MEKLDISKFDVKQKCDLVDQRWRSSDELWNKISDIYKQNTSIYENRAYWLDLLPERRRSYAVQANRIFVNMEAVINTLIANPAGINILPGRDGQVAQDFARKLESFLRKKFTDLNTKETVRMGLRNLYFGRLIVIKPFWNPVINDFDFRAIDPRKVRVAKYARKELDTEFAIEEIEDNLCSVIQRFPSQKEALMKKYGFTNDADLYIKNPDVKYKEAWVQDNVIFKLDEIILDCIRNPYWDWDGILLNEQEYAQLEGDATQNIQPAEGEQRRNILQNAKLAQDERRASYSAQNQPSDGDMQTQQPVEDGSILPTQGATQAVVPHVENYIPYFFNYFDSPRKPYIFATIFNNENCPIGRTDMITLSSSLQKGIDKRKCDIDENAELVNGMLKVDATVMSKAEAQRIRFETKGIIWGKNVNTGVTREMGTPLPQFVFEDMVDSRNEIDNIMAASSAFRGEREGQETKAGRLALIQQSYLRLNELVQVTDYVAHEMFCWALQLAKTRYTEYHYAKWLGREGAREMIELIQDDIENGSEVTVVSGKQLPVDNEFKFEQAQNDVEKGYISPVDYLEIAQYDNSKELSKNAVVYKINPAQATGISPEEMATLAPVKEEKDPPNITVNYKDMPPDAQVQLLASIGIDADPRIIALEKIAEQKQKQEKDGLEAERARADMVNANRDQDRQDKPPEPKKKEK